LKKKVIAKSLPVFRGAARGKVVFTVDEAERMNTQKEDTILVRVETSPEDIHGNACRQGYLNLKRRDDKPRRCGC
jgi:Phosphoenolpyruvate synthase/pyruvate phosphate dikinase